MATHPSRSTQFWSTTAQKASSLSTTTTPLPQPRSSASRMGPSGSHSSTAAGLLASPVSSLKIGWHSTNWIINHFPAVFTTYCKYQSRVSMYYMTLFEKASWKPYRAMLSCIIYYKFKARGLNLKYIMPYGRRIFDRMPRKIVNPVNDDERENKSIL